MGEADAARMLVQSVDVENYTPRMVEVAAQTALATADPAGALPAGRRRRARWSNDPVWILADGMCAALEGESARAGRADRSGARPQPAPSVDLLLAEKVVGAGAETRRAVDIHWEGVDEINPWRFGLASAVGLAIPDRLMNGASPQIHAWLARAPMVPLEQRLQAASAAATLGVFSSHSLVEIYSLMLDETDPAEVSGTVGARLRVAWVAGDPAERMNAMRGLWNENVAAARSATPARSLPPARRRGSRRLDGSVGGRRRSHRVDAERGHGPRGGALGRRRRAGGAGRPRLGSARGRRAAAKWSATGSTLSSRADDSAGRQRSQLLAAALAGPRPDQRRAGLARGLQPRRATTAGRRRSTRRRGSARRAPSPCWPAIGMQTGSWRGVPPPISSASSARCARSASNMKRA